MIELMTEEPQRVTLNNDALIDAWRAVATGEDTDAVRSALWLTAAGKTVGDPNAISVQIGCHIEEFVEFLRHVIVTSHTGATSYALQETAAILDAIAGNIKRGFARAQVYDHEMALDALCDQSVTGNGVAFLLGYNKPAADQAVLDSNDDKFVDGVPVILDGGKIGKRPGWVAPDLSQFV